MGGLRARLAVAIPCAARTALCGRSFGSYVTQIVAAVTTQAPPLPGHRIGVDPHVVQAHCAWQASCEAAVGAGLR